ncbi:hypothetical protein B0H12DRAFT_1012532, partial [Mycena haematopus]
MVKSGPRRCDRSAGLIEKHGLMDTLFPPAALVDASAPRATSTDHVGQAAAARTTRLEDRIAAVQSLLEELIVERGNIKAEIRAHEGALSPLRRLSTELLSLIFIFASRSTNWERQNPAPWIASQVCRRWRAITLSQPSLWTSIDLDF